MEDMDAMDCPVCRRRIPPGAAVCSLACGDKLLVMERERMKLVPLFLARQVEPERPVAA